MIKADLAQLVYETHGGISFREASVIVETILEMVKDSLRKESKVKLTGFGTFTVIRRRPRMGRNPQTGNRMLLDESHYVTFRPSRLLNLD